MTGADEPSADPRQRTLARLAPLCGIVLFGVALAILHHQLRAYHYRDVLEEIRQLPLLAVVAGVLLTAANYFLLTAYEALAFRAIGRPLDYHKIGLASFIGYAVSNSLGCSTLSGGSVRYRLYSSWGLSAKEIAQVIAFITVTFWLGLMALVGLVFVVAPLGLPPGVPAPPVSLHVIGWICLAVVLAYCIWSSRTPAPIKFGGFEFRPPPVRLSLARLSLSTLELLCAAGVLYVLLPAHAGLPYTRFLGMYLVAMVIGLVSQIPGGLGVFETAILLWLSPIMAPSAVLGSLMAYRGIYYLLPLVLAVGLLGAHEVIERSKSIRRRARLSYPFLFP